jgi:hypothetical protein
MVMNSQTKETYDMTKAKARRKEKERIRLCVRFRNYEFQARQGSEFHIKMLPLLQKEMEEKGYMDASEIWRTSAI